jgi:hypothetical protein
MRYGHKRCVADKLYHRVKFKERKYPSGWRTTYMSSLQKWAGGEVVSFKVVGGFYYCRVVISKNPLKNFAFQKYVCIFVAGIM